MSSDTAYTSRAQRGAERVEVPSSRSRSSRSTDDALVRPGSPWAWTAPRRHVQQPAGVEETSDEVSINVVRMGRVPVRAISLREALDEAQGDGNPIVVFRNAESKGVAVIFLRPDGQFGLVEMEA